ncbi:BNR repeat-containing protein [Halobacteria archaeon AArc-m2/3/4]|uniref:BNR repeat-containing protein n=1 Tax=Natronoglomus mannanivorans TaxID=2979990 RepID=A0ABT2QGK5_9EURY|nr:BNR repeat-containing protein [Halobacteria archaeon AArc-m2/3/4]
MASNTHFETVDCSEISDVWTGQSAGPCLYTHGQDQFVAFYAADRSITAGHRRLGDTEWTLAQVSTQRNSVWDHHNELALTVDDDDHLHLVGDMHVDPLNYFRTTEPLDVTSFERVESMVGSDEDRTTYPSFLRGPDDELIVKYRHGGSGAGNWIYNVYHHGDRDWDRLLDTPLTRGGDRASAYPQGPTLGPDDYYHLVWCWRDNPGAQTNHDLYYVRSGDLRNWETARGEPVTLPIEFHQGELIDPVPPYGGLLNSRIRLGFDTQDRAVVSYMKFDPDGNTQIYNARCESHGWNVYKTSDWDYRYSFGGRGSLGTPLQFSGVEIEPDGRLSQTYEHPKYGSGKWILEEETLEATEWFSPWHRYPETLETTESTDPKMRVNWATDSGDSPDETEYLLRWEARDPQHGGDSESAEVPEPTALECYQFESVDHAQ